MLPWPLLLNADLGAEMRFSERVGAGGGRAGRSIWFPQGWAVWALSVISPRRSGDVRQAEGSWARGSRVGAGRQGVSLRPAVRAALGPCAPGWSAFGW